MKEIVVNVNGMMCQNCEKHVNEAVKKLAGVKSAVADKDAKNVVVQAKDDVDVESIKQAVVDAGYEVGESAVRSIEKKGFFSRLKK